MNIFKRNAKVTNLATPLTLPDGTRLVRGLGVPYVLRSAADTLIDTVQLYLGGHIVSEAEWLKWFNSDLRYAISTRSLTNARFYTITKGA